MHTTKPAAALLSTSSAPGVHEKAVTNEGVLTRSEVLTNGEALTNEGLFTSGATLASGEVFTSIAYCYDGTLEGLFSALFDTYLNHEIPDDVASEQTFCPRLGQFIRTIETNEEKALRVSRGIRRACGEAALSAVTNASLSDDVNAGTIVYRFVRYAMQQNRPHSCAGCPKRRNCAGPSTCIMHDSRGSSVLANTLHPSVEPLLRLDRAVRAERHRMLQFLRFEHLENNVWFAKCNPNASVVPLLMDWFSGRFNTQPFLIYDENHHIAGVYEGTSWYLVRTDNLMLPAHASEEKLMQAAWKRFYDTVAIDARYNPELRRQFMPKRFWKNILEMQERTPKQDLSPRNP